MSTEKYTTETRDLVVEGKLWSGAKSRHEYRLKPDVKCETLAHAKAIAGDFMQVTKARIRHTTRHITHIEKVKALK